MVSNQFFDCVRGAPRSSGAKAAVAQQFTSLAATPCFGRCLKKQRVSKRTTFGHETRIMRILHLLFMFAYRLIQLRILCTTVDTNDTSQFTYIYFHMKIYISLSLCFFAFQMCASNDHFEWRSDEKHCPRKPQTRHGPPSTSEKPVMNLVTSKNFIVAQPKSCGVLCFCLLNTLGTCFQQKHDFKQTYVETCGKKHVCLKKWKDVGKETWKRYGLTMDVPF